MGGARLHFRCLLHGYESFLSRNEVCRLQQCHSINFSAGTSSRFLCEVPRHKESVKFLLFVAYAKEDVSCPVPCRHFMSDIHLASKGKRNGYGASSQAQVEIKKKKRTCVAQLEKDDELSQNSS